MSFQRFAKGRLAQEQWRDLDWSGVVAAFQATTPDQRQRFVQAISTRRTDDVGRAVYKIVESYVAGLVQAEYDQIIADGSLSPQEIQRLFG